MRESWGSRAHGVEHLFQQPLRDGRSAKLRRNIQSADQAFLFFQHVKRVTGGGAIFKSHATGQRVRLQKSLDQLQRAAIIPMQFIAPVERFLFQAAVRSGGPWSGVNRQYSWRVKSTASDSPRNLSMIADSRSHAQWEAPTRYKSDTAKPISAFVAKDVCYSRNS